MASTNFINECKTPTYEDRLGKVEVDGVEYNQGNYLTSLELENSIYNNGTIIGNTFTKSLKFSLINVDKDTEFVSKVATPSVGVIFDDESTEYIEFDDYTIEELNDEQTKNFTDITGYDSLNAMDSAYVYGLDDTTSTVHTIAEYWEDLVDNLGLETSTTTFTNSFISIPANPFVNSETNRTVLSEIEKVSCTYSKIEKKTRTVDGEEEVYHEINLYWFNDDKEASSTIDGSGTIDDVFNISDIKLKGQINQNGTPTSSSPVEIETVTGRQEITVSNGTYTKTYEVNLGKNIAVPNELDITRNGITASYNSDTQVFTFNGTCTTDNTTFSLSQSIIDFVSGDTTSSVYYAGGTVSGYCYMRHFNSDYTKSCSYSIEGLTSENQIIYKTTTQTFTTTANTSSSIKFNSGSVVDNFQIRLMITKDYDISYSPYKSPIELCDEEEYLYKENGNWYKHAIIGKTTDTSGSTDITISDMESGGDFYSYYGGTLSGTTITYDSAIGDTNTIYYQLATPINEQIEDEKLINQLNSINLLNGENSISVTSSDLYSILDISYLEDTIDYEFETDDYSTLEGSLTKYGPVNCVILGDPDISGENVFFQDDDNIEENGETQAVISAEYFLYTQALREIAIPNIYKKLIGFEYYDLTLTTYYGKPFLDIGNKIRVNTNENNTYDTFILSHTFTFDGTFKSVIKSPALTKQEEVVKSTESVSSKVKRTEIMVDKANGEISSLTTITQGIKDNLTNNYYNSTQTNELIQTASTGLTNTFSTSGGNNIFRNTGLWFENSGTDSASNPYEFWYGTVEKTKEENASNMSALLLQNNTVYQEQTVTNGTYTISFKYKILIATTVATVKINGTSYSLTATSDTEFTETITTSSQYIKIEFICDTDNGCEIYDLMVNTGEVKYAYSQNQNETTTDTVNISKGITITSSDYNTVFKANADGVRVLDTSENELTRFIDTGMTTKIMEVETQATICDTLIQDINGQTWITRI